MAHFALLWKARTIEKYRQNYENEKYLSIQETNIPIPQKSLSQRLRCYRQDTQKRFSKIFQKIYPEGSSLSHFFLYLRTDQTCLNFVLKSLLGFFIGLALTYLCFLFLVFQLSISLFHATIVSSIIGVLLTMGLAFSYRIRCLIFLLLPQFFSRAGRYTLTCYALVLILTGPATNTLKNSEVLSESMACRQEQIKTLVNEVKQTRTKPLNSMRDSIKIMVQKILIFTRQLKENLLKVNRLTLSVLETIQSTFSWLQWLSEICNKKMGSPYDRCIRVLKEGANNYKRRYKPNFAQIKRLADKVEEICSHIKKYKAICVFTDFVNGSFVATIKRRLKDFSQRIRAMLYLQIHVHHSYSFSSNTNDSASQVAAGIVTEIRKRADPLLTWLSWSSCVTSLFLLLIIFRAKYYQHMFETRSRFDNKYITKELRDLDLNRLRHGRETILPLNRRERSKYVSTTSFRLVASEKIHLNRSIVFMTITTFKLLIHMVADYSLYWVLMTIQHNGKNQTPMPYGVPNAGMHITGTGAVADMFRTLLMALTAPLEIPHPLPSACLPNPNQPDFQRYTQIGILIFLLWFFSLFEPYGLRLRHVVMGLYRPERAKSRAEWLYNHILRIRGGFMKFARRKLHRSYKYRSEEKYTFKKWLNKYIPYWLRYIFRISKDEVRCLLCGTKEILEDPNTKLQKCDSEDCPGVYCGDCFSDIGKLCTICLSPSEYDDLSDVSFEKGSSDESEDESDKGKGVPKHVNESDQNIFHSGSDDILLPKPLRDKNDCPYTTKKSTTEIKSNEITDIKNQTINMIMADFWPIIKFKSFSGFNVQEHRYHHLILYIMKHSTHVMNSFYNNKAEKCYVFKENNILKYILQSKVTQRIRENTEKTTSDEKSNDNNKREDNDKHVPNDLNDKKINKENKANETDESNPSTSKDTNNKNNNKENKGGQDDMMKHESVSWCYFNRFNTMIYAFWPNMKFSLFNACKHASQAVDNNNLGYDKNYKTRKKEEKIDRRIENENARQYRIFAYLEEQDWAVTKTIAYKRTENECFDGEKPDNETIEFLKKDLFSRENIHSLDTENKLPWNTPVLNRHVFICDDCKYYCLCPGNPLNQFLDVTTIGNTDQPKKNNKTDQPKKNNKTDQPKNNKKAEKPNPPPESKETSKNTTTKSDDPKPKKRGILSRMMHCLKSSCFKKRKKKVVGSDKITQDQATSTQIDKAKNNKKIKSHKNRSTQYESVDEVKPKKCEELPTKDMNDAQGWKESPIKNKNDFAKRKKVLVKNKNDTGKRNSRNAKHKTDADEQEEVPIKNKNDTRKRLDTKNNIDSDKQLEVPVKDKSDTRKRKKLDSKNKIDSDEQLETKKNNDTFKKQKDLSMKGKRDVELSDDECNDRCMIHEKCDALCPEECKCNKRGIVIEKCDPLCPEECTCNKKGIVVEQCDPLCPEYCTCGRQGITIKKCDALCPKECTCGGQGIIEKRNDLCSGDCCCKGKRPRKQVIHEEKKIHRSGTKSPKRHNEKPTKKSADNSPSGSEDSHESRKSKSFKKHNDKTTHKKHSASSTSKSTNSNKSMEDENKQTRGHNEKLNCKTCADRNKSMANVKKKKQIDKVKRNCGVEIDCCPPFDCVLCVSEQTMTPDEMYCSCAVQCPPLNRRYDDDDTEECCSNNTADYTDSSSDSCCNSTASDALRSDFTGTDATVRHVYLEKPRKRRVKRTVVSLRNKCIGTDTALKYNVGTITKEKGLVRKNKVYLPENHDICLWDRRFKHDRGVCTKKIVSFRSRVQLIPSAYDIPDIYTPLRYLLESQKYYNELFTATHVYPIKMIQKRTYRRTSSYSDRTYNSRRGRQAKRLKRSLYMQQQKYIPGKQMDQMYNGARYRKSQRKKF